MIPWLDNLNPEFPPVEQALKEPDGLLCAGGNLSVDTLANAYRQGIFPWFSDGQPILWWSPDPRMILTPETLRVSKSMRKLLRQQRNEERFQLTANRAFAQVIQACAEIRQAHEGTWITDDMQSAYIDFHKAGYAHSIEVWLDGSLVGGLYGIAMGRVFFGESMFSRESNTSKLAFITLLQTELFDVVDCQVHTPHLESLGAHLVSRKSFIERIQSLTRVSTRTLTTDTLFSKSL
ncbi:leucyl/phenylalanyl-tRNA--protein transferase [Kistimonas scapharcae]|uniref:Leucyl/phenylalanyl-tRNA--protein transferase n=1 Tax=Kistimonas scapharcae TaxID=1036133 RepID=A0ABP8V5J3_9GAMM